MSSESLAIKCRDTLQRREFDLLLHGTGKLLVPTMSECVVRQQYVFRTHQTGFSTLSTWKETVREEIAF